MTGRRDGFTLFEVLVVVVIISILSIVIMKQFGDLKRRSVESALRGKLASVRGAISIYYSDTEGEYPSDLNLAFVPGSKYLSGLPQGTIPSITSTGNPGHESPMKSARNYDEIPAAGAFQGEGSDLYGYVTSVNSPNYARVFINCEHQDSQGQHWTSR